MPQTGMAQVLGQLAPQKHPDLLVGTETFDDAGVYRLSDELALVQTVDFFPPLVDDPYDFGRIAATNALSDVYAMGGEPLTALNIVCFPDKELPYDILGDILRGGADAAREAGCVIVGGHSVRDAEIKYGMAVTGRVHPQRIWTNAGARPGDVLILTKPLGSGGLCSAAKSGKMPVEDLAPAIEVMKTLNRGARDIAVRFKIHACTDVTGYGLVGHAFEMAAGSGASITLFADAVPLLPRALEFAEQGVLTRAAKTTREHLGNALRIEPGFSEARLGLMMDAQTSGGLLLSVAAEDADALLAALRTAIPSSAIVGMVASKQDASIRILPSPSP